HGITLTLFDEDVLHAAAAQHGAKPLRVHVKIDTGMGRIGLVGEEEAIRYIGKALQTPGVEVEGLYTHYACADTHDKTYLLEQHRRFVGVVEHFRNRGVQFKYLHA